MSQQEWEEGSEAVSIFSIGTLLLQNRWRIARWGLAAALLALALVWTRPALYTASGSFIPQGTDASRAGLASLAGQFGVSLPSAAQGLTPDFYVRLLRSRELLGRAARAKVLVPELDDRSHRVEDLLVPEAAPASEKEEAALAVLSRRVSVSTSKATGVVEFSVATEWPSVSRAIAEGLLVSVNDFNLRTRRDQAGAERRFVETRLNVAAAELRVAEDRLQQFLQTNRQYGSPDLMFTRDRLQRDVTLRQQVFTSLTQAYEDVRMREVRDTPSITVIDEVSVPPKPAPRGRAGVTLIGGLLGLLIGAMIAFSSDFLSKRRAKGDPAAQEFARTASELTRAVASRFKGVGRRGAA